ncbi:Hypothetical protein glysoja_029194 [Glycine soja]|uniref:MAPK kinase substrate protein n=1 Tax=Glycine soja TaxID=3848 RepID=A0A0B2SMD4_GLYSO|nr:Hypothetical protein glysoja_029194 [Glycine soja]
MDGLQRSEVSFRRQGSSGLVWDDKLLSGELNKVNNNEDQKGGGSGGDLNLKVRTTPPNTTIQRSRPEKSRRRSSLPLPSSLLAASAALSGKQGKRAVLSIDQGRFFPVAGDGGSYSSSTRSVYVHLRFRV